MNSIDRINFVRSNFISDEEMWNRIKDQVKILIDAGYIVTIYQSSEYNGSISIGYVIDNPNSGKPFPYFLTKDEVTQVVEYKRKKLLKEYKDKMEFLLNNSSLNFENKEGDDYDEEEDEDKEPHYDA